MLGVVVIESLVEVPVVVTGLKVPDIPSASLEILKVTASVNPDDRVMDTVYVVPDPAVTVLLDGEAEREKSPAGAAFTVCVNADDVLPATLKSPPYVAVIKCSPAERLEVENDAFPELTVAVPIWVVPSLNVTVPVAVAGKTVAVKVTA